MKFHVKGVQVLKGNSGYMLLIPAPLTEDLNNIRIDGDYSIEIKRHSEKRSLNANSYCWLLCQRIAEKLSADGQYISKEEVYRGAIQDSQGFTPICVQQKLAASVCRDWRHNGIGWIAIDTGVSKVKGCTVLHLYAGSSVYDTHDMSRLIDCLVDEASQIGANVEDREWVQALIDDWRPERDE